MDKRSRRGPHLLCRLPPVTLGTSPHCCRAAGVASRPPPRCCCRCLACATADGRWCRSPLARAPPLGLLSAAASLAVFPARHTAPRPPRLPLPPLFSLSLPHVHAAGAPPLPLPHRRAQCSSRRNGTEQWTRACRSRLGSLHRVPVTPRMASSTRWAAPPPRPLPATRRYGHPHPLLHRCRRRLRHHSIYRLPGTEG